MKNIPQNIEKYTSTNLLYLDSPSLNKQLNVSLHFQKLSSIMDGNCTQSKIQNLVALKRQLKNNRSEIIYFLAHSDKDNGMYIGEESNVNGEKLTELFSNQQNRIPKLIIFNTCYGVQSGLVEACLIAGVETVVASEQAVPIGFMCGYMEVLFFGWKNKGLSWDKAIVQKNQNFDGLEIRYSVHKKNNK